MNSTLKSFAHGLGVLGDFAPDPKPLAHKKLPARISHYYSSGDDVHTAWSDVALAISESYGDLTKDVDHNKRLESWKLLYGTSKLNGVDLNRLSIGEIEKAINGSIFITGCDNGRIVDSIKVSCEAKRAG